MSWWFGKKKASPSTPPEATAANIPSSDNDEFIFVEKKSNVQPNLEDGSTRPVSNPLYPPLLPYSLGQTAPGVPSTTHSNQLNRQDSLVYGPHLLQGLPFKLAPNLDSDDSVHMRQYTEFANDVLFQISQINMEAFAYDFSVENSIPMELESE